MKTIENESVKSIKPVFQKLLRSPRVVFSFLFLAPLQMVAPHIYNWYLGQIAHCETHACVTNHEAFGLSINLPMSLTWLFAIGAVSLLGRGLFWGTFEIKASGLMQDFFEQVIHRLKTVRATWFDEHPSGKVINRLFGDFGSLQRRFIFSLSDGAVCYYEMLAGVLMVIWINPWGAVPIALLWFVVVRAQLKMNPAVNHVSAISSKKKGFVIEVLSDVIDGATVYRSYQAEIHILERLRKRVEDWVAIEIFQWRMMTWAWTWMWLLAEAGIAIIVLSAAWAFQTGQIEAALAGMILVAAGQQQSILAWTLDNVGGFLTSRAKAQRFLSLGHLPDETATEHAQSQEAKNLLAEPYPKAGDIEFKDYSASYREDSPVVLQNLNLKIPQGAKLALVGRTGAGKSTIIQGLFRMLHVHHGDLLVGGVSIYGYAPEVTRSIFGIVPQNPWLFAGKIRDNIDVKAEFADEEIARVLSELEIDNFQLEDPVDEGGKNFSVGERQMICLARSLLSDKRIIVMDEPTSHIDLATDAKIQKLIRTKLADRTLIVIAHRKETIADFEMIYSMDERAFEKKYS